MKRRIIMGLLLLGTIGGFGAGIARRHACRRDRFMDRVADECVEAARRTERRERDGRRGDERWDRWDRDAERPDPR